MVVRALQIAVATVMVFCATWNLLYSSITVESRGGRWSQGIISYGSPNINNAYNRQQVEASWTWIWCIFALELGAVAFSLSFSITWLVYTACPRQRARNARCMNKQTPGCMTYTWDLAWDIILMAWWLGLMVAMFFQPYVVAYYGPPILTGWFYLASAMCGLMFVLFLVSAVLSGLVRKRLLMSQKCEKDDIAHKCDVELGQHPAGECDLTPPGVHCEVTRAAESVGLAGVDVGKERTTARVQTEEPPL